MSSDSEADRLKLRNGFRLALILLVALAVVLAIIDFFRAARLNIVVTPIDAKITINGREYSNGTFRFFPGKVTVKIEHDGLATKEIEVELEECKTKQLYEYLVASDESMDYFENSPSDYAVLKLMMTDETAQQYVKKMEDKRAIRDILPLSRYASADTPDPVHGTFSRETRIEDGSNNPECKKIFCLYLVDNTGSDKVAQKLLEPYGYKLSDYEIIRANK